MNVYRDINTMPVFAKAGAIVPMQEDYMENAQENPKQLHLYVYTGADGSFTLYEDDNTTLAYREGNCAKTCYSWDEKEGSLQIHGVSGDCSLIPEKRTYIVTFCGVTQARVSGTGADGESMAVSCKKSDGGMLQVVVEDVPAGEGVVLCLKERTGSVNDVKDSCFKILDRAEIAMAVKERAFHVIETQPQAVNLLGGLLALELDRELYGALAEMITASA